VETELNPIDAELPREMPGRVVMWSLPGGSWVDNRGMGGLPTGTITMLFSDIEGSTLLLRRLGDGYGEALSAQRALLRAAFSACGGQEIGTEGDGFFAVFESAGDAVRCCVAAQRALAGHDWPGGVAVRVRMGLHSGEPAQHEDDYVGLDVHRAARIAAAAHGGQVVLSEATRLLVASRLPAGVSLRDLGLHRLKDIEAPERIYQLVAAGLPESFPPLKSLGGGLAAGVHGFPPELTSFVGRAPDLDEVADLLASYRLVTVNGPGGVGKTRLAGAVAKRVADRFAEGVWLAELASVSDGARVAPAVAAALGVLERPGVAAADALAEVLATRQVLLVLDNCEHVIGAVAELCGALLSAADDVRVLATSREVFGVTGEARYRLAPLDLPALQEPNGVSESGAVALFADRARQADPHFMVSAETGPVVARLVTRLDGMPLAIELAAARVEALGVVPLLERLDDQFALLAGSDRLAEARHRSLAATVEWSYQLLSELERRVFRHVSVFPGPFTLGAAETLAGPDAGTAVFRLVDCSLLVPPSAGPDGRARYVMLQTLRSYGLARLADAGEQPAAAAALARHALEVAGQAAAGLATSTGELAAIRLLDAEDATMRQALAWALEHDPDAALRLAVALAPWWRSRGRGVEGYSLLRAAAGHAAPRSDAWCAAQIWLALLALYFGDLADALGHCTAVRDAISDRGPSRALADSLIVQSHLGTLPGAAADARRALEMARELGYPAGEALALAVLGIAAYDVGSPQEALAWQIQVDQIAPEHLPGWIVRNSKTLMTGFLIETGELAAARRTCADGLALCREAGDLTEQNALLTQLAILDRLAGDLASAATHLRESLETAARIGDQADLLNCVHECGHLCAATGRWAEAVTLWAAHTAQSQDAGFSVSLPATRRRQQGMRKAARALGAARTRAARQRGAAMTLETAVEFAAMLATAGPPPSAGLDNLNTWERQLVTLVARGNTDAQIAAQLSSSVRAVRADLDRVRDKTRSRRRADLTRLALSEGLI
jgi:predicted ATPase/class 3 adenylate cyclase/DNA-binding CsgD family transcriptional regulator